MERLFAYGTLMDPEILASVIGGPRAGRPAQLKGYRRFRVRDTEYPAILRAGGGMVAGVLYAGLLPRDWSRLDRFEGGLYRRELVQVRDASGRWQSAGAYVLRPERRAAVSAEAWDFARFLSDGKQRFAREYEGFRRRW